MGKQVLATFSRRSAYFLPAFFLLAAFLLFTASKCKKDGDQSSKFSAADRIEMSKTACFGGCPVFEFTLTGAGQATYNGIRFTEKEGKFTRNFERAITDSLFHAFLEANFWDFDDEYTAEVTDLPTTFLTLTHGDRNKRIKMYYEVPEALRELEKKVDELANAKDWEAAN